MPPYDMWLSGRDDILRWWYGPGIGCKGSRILRPESANGMPTFGQYKPSPSGGYDPPALPGLPLSGGGGGGGVSFFLPPPRPFPPLRVPLPPPPPDPRGKTPAAGH